RSGASRVTRAADLTRQILAFSRRQALRPEVVTLNNVVSGIERLLRRTLGEDVHLVTRLAPDLAMAEVDVSQMENVVMNLALNARDAMPHGGELTVETANAQLSQEYCRAHPGTSPGRWVTLAVSDTGVGMDDVTMARIFEPFFTTKERGRGTGLGLATVYGIVKQSGGNITVQSTPGQGTKFTVFLPCAEKAPEKLSEAPGEAEGTRGGESILVVEDEPAVARLIRQALERSGFTVLAAGTGDEGLLHLNGGHSRVDLLLTDIVLPGTLQGHQLGQRAIELRPALPIIYMSGYTGDAVMQGGGVDGRVNYIQKPFTPESLVRMVREVLDSRKGRRAAGCRAAEGPAAAGRAAGGPTAAGAAAGDRRP
ncbi:MAG: ATP-binding protein, partial [Actinobacteria bacterium]|nr:ATP-binding protein [Actinomycetota bacterium]